MGLKVIFFGLEFQIVFFFKEVDLVLVGTFEDGYVLRNSMENLRKFLSLKIHIDQKMGHKPVSCAHLCVSLFIIADISALSRYFLIFFTWSVYLSFSARCWFSILSFYSSSGWTFLTFIISSYIFNSSYMRNSWL